MPKIADLETPCVLIDAARVEANLVRAQAHANANGYRLRPHIKTHKIPRFARRQVELGAIGITAQKLGEGEVMADGGLTDIFLPYNIVGASKLARLVALNRRIKLSVTADSREVVAGYAAAFTDAEPLMVLVECDTGGGRCGVQSPAAAVELASVIAAEPALRLGGLMTYPPRGQSAASDHWLGEAKAALQRQNIAVRVITSGNTPDMWHTGDRHVTERRPGTYIYFDRAQVSFGVASLADCALTVLATVVSRPTPRRVVLDAGSKALSSDLFGQSGYGLLMERPEYVLTALSEEHGVIELASESDWPRIGDRVRIVPNHACVVSNLFDSVQLVGPDGEVETLPVAARGRLD